MRQTVTPRPAVTDESLQEQLVAILARFEYERTVLAEAGSQTDGRAALQAVTNMTDRLVRFAETELTPQRYGALLTESAGLLAEVQVFQRAARPSFWERLGLARPDPGRHQRYRELATASADLLARFLDLFRGWPAPGKAATEWARASETFIDDLRQTLLAIPA